MSLIMRCATCRKEVEGDTEYYNVHLGIRDEDHREDSIDNKYDDFCEECIKNNNVAGYLLALIDKRNPKRIKKH